mmetsp:Transcript_44254/g.128078  ORF Transcript_44254/g.128078 Transcript_44254/m.128078 type:complete len:230 (-) Transcript_44254:337-1026(-)
MLCPDDANCHAHAAGLSRRRATGHPWHASAASSRQPRAQQRCNHDGSPQQRNAAGSLIQPMPMDAPNEGQVCRPLLAFLRRRPLEPPQRGAGPGKVHAGCLELLSQLLRRPGPLSQPGLQAEELPQVRSAEREFPEASLEAFRRPEGGRPRAPQGVQRAVQSLNEAGTAKGGQHCCQRALQHSGWGASEHHHQGIGEDCLPNGKLRRQVCDGGLDDGLVAKAVKVCCPL